MPGDRAQPDAPTEPRNRQRRGTRPPASTQLPDPAHLGVALAGQGGLQSGGCQQCRGAPVTAVVDAAQRAARRRGAAGAAVGTHPTCKTERTHNTAGEARAILIKHAQPALTRSHPSACATKARPAVPCCARCAALQRAGPPRAAALPDAVGGHHKHHHRHGLAHGPQLEVGRAGQGGGAHAGGQRREVGGERHKKLQRGRRGKGTRRGEWASLVAVGRPQALKSLMICQPRGRGGLLMQHPVALDMMSGWCARAQQSNATAPRAVPGSGRRPTQSPGRGWSTGPGPQPQGSCKAGWGREVGGPPLLAGHMGPPLPLY